MEVNIKRTALNITTFCNLKCKHCLAFIPYYENKYSMSYVEASNILKVYFKIVDSVEHFTVTGGEPLLNKDIYNIFKELYRYESQITRSIDFVTNGTMEIPESLLQLFELYNDKTKVILSDYGEGLSTKIVMLEEELKKRNINFRTSKFHGDNLYYDGWIDFSNHDLKWESIKERNCNAQKCIQRVGKYFVIYN